MRIVKVTVSTASGGSRLDHLFDAKNGYGAVPNSESIDYFGFTVYMKPYEFLALAAPNKHLDYYFYTKCLEDKQPIGYPFFIVKKKEQASTLKMCWKVLTHEGRNRCMAIRDLYGPNVEIPVHIFPEYGRNRNISQESLAWPFIPEKGTIKKSIVFSPDKIDFSSKGLNVGRYPVTIKYGRHSQETAAPVWQSDMNRKASPADLKKEKRNEDDVTEQVLLQEQPMHVYHNPCPAFTSKNQMRRVN